MQKEQIKLANSRDDGRIAEQVLYALPSLAHMTKPSRPFVDAAMYVENAQDTKKPVTARHAPRPLTRQVYHQHLNIWGRLKREALRARESYVFTARAAAVAQFRGQGERSERLARLAYKQRVRWCDASRALDFFEN